MALATRTVDDDVFAASSIDMTLAGIHQQPALASEIFVAVAYVSGLTRPMMPSTGARQFVFVADERRDAEHSNSRT